MPEEMGRVGWMKEASRMMGKLMRNSCLLILYCGQMVAQDKQTNRYFLFLPAHINPPAVQNNSFGVREGLLVCGAYLIMKSDLIDTGLK